LLERGRLSKTAEIASTVCKAMHEDICLSGFVEQQPAAEGQA
jgi:hypothetical protein